MGRGSSNQAISAKGLLYGPRRSGDGPVLIKERQCDFTAIFDQLESGSLTVRPHRLLPPQIELRQGKVGSDNLGEYAHAEVTNVWNEPVGLLARSTKQDNFLLVNYCSSDYQPDDDIPNPGTDREKAFLKSLAQTFAGDERVYFSFEYEGQLESFIAAYGPSPFKIANHLSHRDGPEPTQKEVIVSTARCGVLVDEDIAALESCSNFTEAWNNLEARQALTELAEHGELCLSRPLSHFANMVI